METPTFPLSGIAILGIGTAVPPYRLEQDETSRRIADGLSGHGDAARWVRRIFRQTSVERRYTCEPDLLESAHRSRYAPGAARPDIPATAERMDVYRREAVPLALAAARRALRDSGVAASGITHLITVSCTGFILPGLDCELVWLLGLSRDVNRVPLTFVGCAAGMTALRLARELASGDPRANVLIVCVELCTIHIQPSASRENLFAASLFGDGAAACVVGRVSPRRDAGADGSRSWQDAEGGESRLRQDADADAMDAAPHRCGDVADSSGTWRDGGLAEAAGSDKNEDIMAAAGLGRKVDVGIDDILEAAGSGRDDDFTGKAGLRRDVDFMGTAGSQRNDGFMETVGSRRDDDTMVENGTRRSGVFVLGRARATLLPGTMEEMWWKVGNTGFRLYLSPQIPSLIGRHVPAEIARLQEDGDDPAPEWWAIHPGGRGIIDVLQQALELTDAQTRASRDVLRRFGNMSSATILFVLREIRRELDARAREPKRGMALAFGPGMNAELMRIDYVPAGSPQTPGRPGETHVAAVP